MSSPVATRPSFFERRSSSQSRRSRSTTRQPHPASGPSSPVGSPPSHSTPLSSSSSHLALKSALKHNHVHPEPRGIPRDDDGDDGGDGDECWRPTSPVLASVDSSDPTQQQQQPFQRKVGFDTLIAGIDLDDKGASTGGGTGVNYTFTIGAKSAGFCRTRWTRTYLVATDLNEYSVHALTWAIHNITESHDELVILRVIDPSSSSSTKLAMNEAAMEDAREEAEGVLADALKRARGEKSEDGVVGGGEALGGEKQISIIVEFAIGPVEETIHRMIEIYRPDSLIVGTRGSQPSLLSSLSKGAYMGSISKWAVARSPVPVIVVRPLSRVRESLAGREKKSRSYVSLLGDKAAGTHSTSRFARDPAGQAELGALQLHRVTTAPANGANGDATGLQRRRSIEFDERSAGQRLREKEKERDRAAEKAGSKESRKTKKGKALKKFSTFG